MHLVHSKKWVSINSRLSKDDIITQLKQFPLDPIFEKADRKLEGYRFVDIAADYSVHDLKYSIDCDKDCLLVFTSGSGGNPKAVVHSLKGLILSAKATVTSTHFLKMIVGYYPLVYFISLGL